MGAMAPICTMVATPLRLALAKVGHLLTHMQERLQTAGHPCVGQPLQTDLVLRLKLVV